MEARSSVGHAQPAPTAPVDEGLVQDGKSDLGDGHAAGRGELPQFVEKTDAHAEVPLALRARQQALGLPGHVAFPTKGTRKLMLFPMRI